MINKVKINLKVQVGFNKINYNIVLYEWKITLSKHFCAIFEYFSLLNPLKNAQELYKSIILPRNQILKWYVFKPYLNKSESQRYLYLYIKRYFT